MKRGKAKVFLTLLVILIAGIYYYVTIPAVNIHASGFWTFILTVIILLLAAYGIKMRFTSFQEAKNSKVLRIGLRITSSVSSLGVLYRKLRQCRLVFSANHSQTL